MTIKTELSTQKYSLTIRKKHRKNFSTSGRLFFYCTSHPSMLDDFIIDGKKEITTTHFRGIIRDASARHCGKAH